jgi:hypothetical protein
MCGGWKMRVMLGSGGDNYWHEKESKWGSVANSGDLCVLQDELKDMWSWRLDSTNRYMVNGIYHLLSTEESRVSRELLTLSETKLFY